jgi:hypothetical protein
MFNTLAHTAIDTFQTGKKFAITNTVKYEPLADIMNTFVDTQTTYTKTFIDSLLTTGTKMVELSMSKDFGKAVTESYIQPLTKAAAASRKAK